MPASSQTRLPERFASKSQSAQSSAFSRAGRKQLLKVIAIQIAHGSDRFNLRQNGSRTLIIARDRHAFAASSVFSLSHAYHYDVRLGATAARDAKRVLEWPEFFFGFDFQNGE